MPGPFKTDIETALLKRLNRLIEEGEIFYKIASHPGKTQTFENWREEINGMVATVWGTDNHYFGSLARVSIFPRWFDPKIHGPFKKGEIGRVITDSHQHDANTAFELYKEGVGKIVALLKSMKNDIDDFGVPEKQTSWKKEYPLISLTNSNNPTINNTNHQSQNQSQIQTTNISIQNLAETIEKKLEDKSLQPHEKSFLEKVRGGLSTIKTAGELIGLALEACQTVGLSASRAAQLLGIGQ
jgi:hypothetical protein